LCAQAHATFKDYLPMKDLRQWAPATTRNRDPILEILRTTLPEGLILEVASGSGEHAVYFAPQLPGRVWLPSDVDPTAIASIEAWQREQPCDRFLAPLCLDLATPQWVQTLHHWQTQHPNQPAPAAIVAINLIHISPWTTTLNLIAGAAQCLPSQGILFLYGPYFREGYPTAPSNVEFDAILRSRNPAWGVRALETVVATAATAGFKLQSVHEMPANNLCVILESGLKS
jgi:hypothetical protein